MQNQISWETRKKMLKKKGWELIKDGNSWAYVNNGIMYFVQDFKDMDDNEFYDIAMNGEMIMISNEALQEWIDNIDTDRWSELLNVLKELKERRESDLIPATKFLDQPLSELVRKVVEECDEASDEINILNGCNILEYYDQIENYDHLLEELTDLQFAAETAKARILSDVEDRWAVRRQVREKNAKRGYYEVGK